MASVATLLGVMELESGPSLLREIPDLTYRWLKDAGGFAVIGFMLWSLYVMATPSPAIAGGRRKLISPFMAVTGTLSLIGYLIAIGLMVMIYYQTKDNPVPPRMLVRANALALVISGALALLAFCEPFVVDLFRLRGRRIYAIAKLSFKEAVRKKIVWVFFIPLVVFLFPASWFFHQQVKAEDYLKRSIDIQTGAIMIVLIFTALLLSGFSIPNDVKNQTIHTIVTKPVERFEIVVGRFLGYLTLETIFLVVLTGVSLISIFTSNVNEAAREESMKAREAVYGQLMLRREKGLQLVSDDFKGIDVGREYNVRKYIAGGLGTPHRAVWFYSDVGELKDFADMPVVPMEFAFDVYRTTKGEENRGVLCTFEMMTHNWDVAKEDEYRKEMSAAFGSSSKNIRPDEDGKPSESARQNWEKVNKIAEKYGRYEFVNVPISDYHTYQIPVPPGLFKNALGGTPNPTPAQGPGRLQVRVQCGSASQFLGVAPLDLYFLESEGRGKVDFVVNFFKASLGVWCRLVIVIGLAVSASTYLAGVVSFLAAAFLFLSGYFQDFIRSLANHENIGGGPAEAFTRLMKGTTGAGELDKTPSIQAALLADDGFRWLLKRILNVIPDPERFGWSAYLEQGFSIRYEFIAVNLIFLAAYMLPWAVLAYYLMRSREVAA